MILLLIAVMGALSSCVTPVVLSPSEERRAESIVEVEEEFEILGEIYDQLERNFVDPEKIAPFSLANGAIEGITQFLEKDAQKDALRDEFQNCTGDVTEKNNLEPDLEPDSVFNCLVLAYSSVLPQEGAHQTTNIREVSDSAAEAMVASLEDRYTSYARPELFQIRQSSSQGEFEGIGAYVQFDEDTGYFTVYPMEDSPAQKAGLVDGDRVVAVDNKDVIGLSFEEFVVKVRGPRGETVVLTIERGEENSEKLDVSVIRDTIKQPAVNFEMIQGTPYGYIRINAFSVKASRELKDALESLSSKDPRGFVIDLRFNPGGLLGVTVDSVGQFLSKGSIVLSSTDAQQKSQNFSTSQSGDHQSIPLVVLVNSLSASGSEVFSGALQDHDRAILVGQSTFGKGSVTSVISLDDGAGLYVTSARWRTPDGRLIDGSGIEPDILVEQPLDIDLMSDDDLQFFKALEILAEMGSP